MNEKVYQRLSLTGALDITIGIVILTIGTAAGVLAIINGAKLLGTRKNIMF